ncbi:hypothetical protein DFH07DRAFT_1038081 [Mycena maculata]|uniref:Ubiquitin-like protease family profile domain-containing protein n=1 Tax=Mycena maculata TaxID=230809 RepID=A0AAD7N5T5_9AGAR|nr:hypothetical protein DFH07DRAFT_1038081 [Mycena maculata]
MDFLLYAALYPAGINGWPRIYSEMLWDLGTSNECNQPTAEALKVGGTCLHTINKTLNGELYWWYLDVSIPRIFICFCCAESDGAVAQFNASRHEIRGVQVVSDDLAPFQKGRKLKIPGTAMNAVGALMQLLAEEAGNSGFAIFSSWLGPLIAKKVPQNKMYGTINGHIVDTCQGAPLQILLAKNRWIFPMYGSDPPHWVLGWIEPGSRQYHIFDSVPELRSFSWAEPDLLELGDTIYATLGYPKFDWEPWSRVLHSPPELGRQMNSWACGFFVIHAMRVVANGDDIQSVTNTETERVREESLALVLDNLPLFRPPVVPTPSEDVEMPLAEPVPVEEPAEPPFVSGEVRNPGDNQPRYQIFYCTVATNELMILGISAQDELPSVTGTIQISPQDESIAEDVRASVASSSKRKLEPDDPPVTGGSEDRQPSKKSKYIKAADRQKILEGNKWISVVESHRVKCKGCSDWIKLDKKSPFKMENWTRHEGTCFGITGRVSVRTAVVKSAPTKPVKGAGSLYSFFGKGKQKDVPVPVANVARDSESEDEPVSQPKSTVTYVTHSVRATPIISNYFALGAIKSHPRERIPTPEPPEPRSCRHLSGEDYTEYIERTETRTMGGISVQLRGRIARQIFMYKKLKLAPEKKARRKEIEVVIPEDGNECISSSDWTDAEHVRLYEELKGYARWEVNYNKKTVRSARCEGLTSNADGICDACQKIAADESLRHAVNLKKREAKLPLEEQHSVLMARDKYSSRRFHDDEARNLNDQLKDPLVFKAFKALQKGETTECFIQLYEACLNGQLKKYETFKQLCGVLTDVLQREGTDKKYGIRYPADYLNFMTLLRSYGGQSARQYSIIAGQLPCPSSRQLRALVSKSEDALQNPYLIFENMARVKRLVDSIKYTGPVAVAGDCTKVRKRLTYSTEFGGHILGGVLPFDQCVVESPEEIDNVIARITKAKAEATQVRAILVKVPLPHVPPQVVALIPTDGKDDAAKIIEQNLKLLQMAEELGVPVVVFSADGAASELLAQNMFDKLETDCEPFTYAYPLYGIHLRTPVFKKTGPVVALTDAPHGSKTGRNQPEYGTHTASLGKGKVVNNDLVRLQRTGKAGLLKSDVTDVDKQDDGPARRLWHHAALLACTMEDEDGIKIQPGFEAFIVHFLVVHAELAIGVLFDAWLNRTMTIANRVLAVLRARFWLHFWRAHIVNMSTKYPDLYSTARSFISPASFHIFNRLCDSLLLLVLIYARHYPDQPFCPWLLGTEFVEHFFGLARMMLPNFTYAEFLKMVQHMMVRQRILLSGRFKEKRERNANVGYVLDFDASPLTAKDRKLAEVQLTDSDLNALVELAFQEASLICTQLLGIPAPKPTNQKPLALTPLGAPLRKGKQLTQHDDSHSESDFDPDEEDANELDEQDVPEPPAGVGDSRALALAAHDTARYAALCEDYDNAVGEVESDPVVFGPPPPPPPHPSTSSVTTAAEIPTALKSEIIDGGGRLSIALMVQARLHWQSGTTTRSQKMFRLDSKYALARISRGVGREGEDDTEPEKMTHQEATQRVRIAQDSNNEIQASKPRTAREMRWKNIAATLQKLVNTDVLPNISAKNVHQLNPLSIGSFGLMWNGTRFYIEDSPTASGLAFLSLRVYLPLGMGTATSSESDSDDDRDAAEIDVPLFSCNEKAAHLHTHAKIEHLIFHLGRNIFEREDRGVHRTLTAHAATRWNMLTKPGPASKEVKKVTLKLKKS